MAKGDTIALAIGGDALLRLTASPPVNDLLEMIRRVIDACGSRGPPVLCGGGADDDDPKLTGACFVTMVLVTFAVVCGSAFAIPPWTTLESLDVVFVEAILIAGC